jgi:hypothetical protein
LLKSIADWLVAVKTMPAMKLRTPVRAAEASLVDAFVRTLLVDGEPHGFDEHTDCARSSGKGQHDAVNACGKNLAEHPRFGPDRGFIRSVYGKVDDYCYRRLAGLSISAGAIRQTSSVRCEKYDRRQSGTNGAGLSKLHFSEGS